MYVEDLLRPMPFLNIMPLGNVKLDEVTSYIKAGASVVGIGRDSMKVILWLKLLLVLKR